MKGTTSLKWKSSCLMMTKSFDRLFQMVFDTEIEFRQLAATRDYLLPKLLSGEVGVAVDSGIEFEVKTET